MSIEQVLPQEHQACVELYNSLEQKEDVPAFLNKRKPVFLNE